MEESKELQTAYQIFRWVIYLSLLLEFFEYAIDPAILDYAIPGNDDAVKAIKLLVGVMNDAIVEAKGGLLEFAYTTDELPEVTMSDVIIAVQEQAAENERRRKSKEKRRRGTTSS